MFHNSPRTRPASLASAEYAFDRPIGARSAPTCGRHVCNEVRGKVARQWLCPCRSYRGIRFGSCRYYTSWLFCRRVGVGDRSRSKRAHGAFAFVPDQFHDTNEFTIPDAIPTGRGRNVHARTVSGCFPIFVIRAFPLRLRWVGGISLFWGGVVIRSAACMIPCANGRPLGRDLR